METGISYVLFTTAFLWISQNQTLKLGFEHGEFIWNLMKGNVDKGVGRKAKKNECLNQLPWWTMSV